ncbi:hypothetical protein VAA_00065 [Vibrio anguillarum 775]|nr:hypothetical protein VAA_00065 [Vibrio anguillarum 775]AGU59034.1 hypothetical protein N175_14535 [Vibrio anguillarum M3]
MPTRGGFSAKLKFSVYSGFLSSAVRCQPLSRALAEVKKNHKIKRLFFLV